MWGSTVAGILSIFASLLGRKTSRDLAKNTPEMKANRESKDEVARQDEIETKVIRALNSDEQALKDLRDLSAE